MPRNSGAQTSLIFISEAKSNDLNSKGSKEWKKKIVGVKPWAHLVETNGDQNPNSLEANRVQAKRGFYWAEDA